jgi:hypothetical protein
MGSYYSSYHSPYDRNYESAYGRWSRHRSLNSRDYSNRRRSHNRSCSRSFTPPSRHHNRTPNSGDDYDRLRCNRSRSRSSDRRLPSWKHDLHHSPLRHNSSNNRAEDIVSSKSNSLEHTRNEWWDDGEPSVLLWFCPSLLCKVAATVLSNEMTNRW